MEHQAGVEDWIPHDPLTNTRPVMDNVLVDVMWIGGQQIWNQPAQSVRWTEVKAWRFAQPWPPEPKDPAPAAKPALLWERLDATARASAPGSALQALLFEAATEIFEHRGQRTVLLDMWRTAANREERYYEAIKKCAGSLR